MERTIEQRLSELYIANLDVIGEGFPAIVNSERRGFLENFNLAGLPGSKDERYRHTDVRDIFSRDWEHFFEPVTGDSDFVVTLPQSGYSINVVNGFCSEGLRTRADGIIYGSLRTAAKEHGELFAKHYNSLADNESNPLTALNSLFMQDGAFIYVPKGVDAGMPFVVSFGYGARQDQRMCFSRTLIVMEEGAKADVVISHRVVGEVPCLVSNVRETILSRDAVLHLSEATTGSEESAIFAASYIDQHAGSRSESLGLWLGGGATRTDVVTQLKGEHCESNLYGLFFGTGDDLSDINVRVDHMVPDCKSFELVKGVVAGEAVGAFNGLVYVARDAQRTLALQQSRNLQLSESAHIYAEPQLEIYADDVKCSHGATVGQMNDDAVYYMRQRGISEQDARRLQLAGFVNDIVSRCPLGDCCGYFASLAEERVHGI